MLSFALFISFAWCPKIKKLQIQVKKCDDEDYNIDASNDVDDAVSVAGQKIRLKTARQKISMITAIVKLCLTPFVAALCAVVFKLNVQFRMLDEGFRDLAQHNLLPLFLINILSGYLSQFLGRLGCKMGLQKPCFALPLILSTPVSIILVGAFEGCKYMRICLCSTQLSRDDMLETVILAVVLWLAQIFSTTIYLWQSQDFLMAKEWMLFWLPCYDGEL